MVFFWNKDKKAFGKTYKMKKGVIKGKDVLELATGNGLIVYHTASVAHSYIATDFSEKTISKTQADKHFNMLTSQGVELMLEQADPTYLLYPDDFFDVVIITNALQTMRDPDVVLENVRRVLRPGGVLIAPTYVHDEDTWWQRFKLRMLKLKGMREYSHWTEKGFHQYLQSHGFSIMRSRIFDAFFPMAYVECKME